MPMKSSWLQLLLILQSGVAAALPSDRSHSQNQQSLQGPEVSETVTTAKRKLTGRFLHITGKLSTLLSEIRLGQR